MNRIDLNARLREIEIEARHSEEEAIKMLCELIRDLNDELEELKGWAEDEPL